MKPIHEQQFKKPKPTHTHSTVWQTKEISHPLNEQEFSLEWANIYERQLLAFMYIMAIWHLRFNFALENLSQLNPSSKPKWPKAMRLRHRIEFLMCYTIYINYSIIFHSFMYFFFLLLFIRPPNGNEIKMLEFDNNGLFFFVEHTHTQIATQKNCSHILISNSQMDNEKLLVLI